ncbi:hypothetical protein ACIBI3_16040 [Actinomadura luteofluorescens]|uniref:hypothetical protein n=1 Tax=Actinomadura luteofluorescens TaxID=46163 RepID=UPI00348BF567
MHRGFFVVAITVGLNPIALLIVPRLDFGGSLAGLSSLIVGALYTTRRGGR